MVYFVDFLRSFLQAPKEKKEKADKPKRAPSAYIIFCTEKRTEIKDANPEATFGELGKLLGAAWKEMSDKDKAPFTKAAEAAKAAL